MKLRLVLYVLPWPSWTWNFRFDFNPPIYWYWLFKVLNEEVLYHIYRVDTIQSEKELLPSSPFLLLHCFWLCCRAVQGTIVLFLSKQCYVGYFMRPYVLFNSSSSLTLILENVWEYIVLSYVVCNSYLYWSALFNFNFNLNDWCISK